MELQIVNGTKRELPQVLSWLKQEDAETGEGFYCNRDVIARSFLAGSALCTLLDGQVVGFAVYYLALPGSGVSIVEVRPQCRKRGVGAHTLSAAVQRLKSLGAEYVHAECTSTEGEALCRAHGFQTYVDPRNYRSPHASPELRLVLRPPAIPSAPPDW